MNTFKKKTWTWALVLSGGVAALAASGAFDTPPQGTSVQAAIVNGHPALPPSFSIADVFKAPH